MRKKVKKVRSVIFKCSRSQEVVWMSKMEMLVEIIYRQERKVVVNSRE